LRVVLRNGVELDDPVAIVVGYVEAWQLEASVMSAPATFGEADLRRANREGARMSAAEIDQIVKRRGAIERALGAIAPDASLSHEVPWTHLEQLFEAFAGIRGVGISKMTKTLHRKRPALIPILDSVVQRYLADDNPGARAPFGERALALVRGYKRDLDRNGAALRTVHREVARRGHGLSEVRILDLLIWSAEVTPRC
jgi:Family of unknown function (DUF6308)